MIKLVTFRNFDIYYLFLLASYSYHLIFYIDL